MQKREAKQRSMWVATPQLPKAPGHVFYDKLNQEVESGFGAGRLRRLRGGAVRAALMPTARDTPIRQFADLDDAYLDRWDLLGLD